jgi:hypothetical protein
LPGWDFNNYFSQAFTDRLQEKLISEECRRHRNCYNKTQHSNGGNGTFFSQA